MRARSNKDRLDRLTHRERSVMTLLAEGRFNRSIANRLMFSITTIEAALASIFSKIDPEPDPDNNRRVLATGETGPPPPQLFPHLEHLRWRSALQPLLSETPPDSL